MGDYQHSVLLEADLEAYRNCFDHVWASKIGSEVAGTLLEETILDLCRSWKSTASAQSFPWVAAHAVELTLAGFDQERTRFTKTLLAVVAQRMRDAVAGKLSSEDHRRLREQADKVAETLDSSFPAGKPPLLAGDVWLRLLEFPSLVMATDKLCTSCFVTTYYAYEDFVARVLRAAMDKKDNRWSRFKRLQRDFRATFGDELCHACLSDNAINAARLVRNAVVHHGGRVTKELAAIEHSYEIVDQEVAIRARETKSLYDPLKARVSMLVTAALRLLADRDASS